MSEEKKLVRRKRVNKLVTRVVCCYTVAEKSFVGASRIFCSNYEYRKSVKLRKEKIADIISATKISVFDR